MPLVRATESGTEQTESLLRGKGDVEFGLGFFLAIQLEVCWKASGQSVILA